MNVRFRPPSEKVDDFVIINFSMSGEEEEFYQEEENFEDSFDDNQVYDDYVTYNDDDDDDIIFTPDDTIDTRFSNIQNIVSTYCAYMYESPADLLPSGSIEVDIPRTFLPLSLQAVYGFLVNDYVLHLSFELQDFDWSRHPNILDIKHPVYGPCYVGNALVNMAVSEFFTPSYKPRQNYRSAPYFLCSSGHVDYNKVTELQKLGFSSAQSQRALLLCSNHLDKTITFLRTGELPAITNNINFSECASFRDCPLMYLVLEIADCFLDLQDHCSICRCPSTPGLKPSICNKELCNFRFSEIGIGTSVIQEIRRDPLVADLILSMFSAAIKTPYLTPSPPGYTDPQIEKICATMPQMAQLASSCQSDQDLTHQIGSDAVQLLRWVLLSNRSHLIYLPPQLSLPQFKSSKQFMALISSPESENAFQELKEKYGSIYLWHGSNGERWHSIVRNGLKNATGTKLQANGSALGEGIYFARDSKTSWGYSRTADNRYRASQMGKQLHIISLVEIAKIPMGKNVTVTIPCRDAEGNLTQKNVTGFLKNHQWAHTLTLEEACVVRFLMVGGDFEEDVLVKPPRNVPTLKDVLNYHIEHSV
ncbi:UBA/TS-N domain containing protein [Tritrichomonas foetus]|uniref:UBA/TS-N domain containing protein n=1 Tax=Tritrichomonas foetus TaxID=1144522 RepID=A0A1J4KBX0_9EUKA|nr:UBA/TS-N domain containing protein [Tritrichomonas foetus]|eukprot:OHT07174.1 UBA/TS-N domain containing protein [Tritrichomonas foetus]